MMIVIQVIVLLLIVYIIHNSYLKYRKIHDKEIRGPFPIPILGNLHSFSELPHRDCTKLTKKYGDVLRIWFADLYTVILSDPSIIRKVYIDNHENFRDRPRIPTMKYGTYFHGTVASMGEDWEHNRDIVSRAMRKTNIKHIYDLIDKEVDVLLNTMNKISKEGTQFDARYYVTKFTMSLMYKFLFNEEVDENEDYEKGDIQRLSNIMSKIMEDFATGSLWDVLEISRPFYLKYLETFEPHYPVLLKFFETRFNKHIETFNPEAPRDLLDTLISEYGGGDLSKTTKDDMLNISSSLLDFLFAGVDTSSTCLEYLILALTNESSIQEKVHAEIKSLVNSKGRDRVLLSDRSSLPYLCAVIKETLRYYPVTALGLPRSTTNDIVIDDKYFIPKDSQILINYHAMFQSEDHFPNPHVFDPMRFINNPNNPAFIPFSIGNRNCVGQNFANDEIFLCAANVLLNYKFTPIDGKKINETEKYGVTLKPLIRFKVLLERRLLN